MDADDSVFDWGRASLASVAAMTGGSERTLATAPTTQAGGDAAAGAGNANIARYTPNTINRITDITDLVADSSEESDDDAIDGLSGRQKNGKRRVRSVGGEDTGAEVGRRRALFAVFLVAVLVAAGAGILYAVRDGGARGDGRVARQQQPQQQQQQLLQQQLLQIAELLTLVCSEHRLDDDISECQDLCQHKMCCFNSEPYSCRTEEESNCAVYAPCEALR